MQLVMDNLIFQSSNTSVFSKLDVDVLACLTAQGQGNQIGMNTILRYAVENHS